ncbi:MAG TPA: hypothetical protein VIL60_00130 [Rhodanobacter sp.]
MFELPGLRRAPKLFIDGQWVAAGGKVEATIVNLANGQIVSRADRAVNISTGVSPPGGRKASNTTNPSRRGCPIFSEIRSYR